MPHINGVINNRQIIIPILIYKAGTLAANNGLPPQSKQWNALVDTGAMFSCISRRCIQELQLVQRGEDCVNMNSASGTYEAKLYAIDFWMPTTLPNATKGEIYEVIECSGGNTYDVIIGMDIILKGTLNLSSDGHFTLSLL